MAIISDPKETEKTKEAKKTFDFDVFISHASVDTAWCKKFVNRLEKRYKLKVWFDESQLRGGAILPTQIGNGLDASKCFVPVLSPAYFEKNWTQAELNAAIHKDPDGRRGFILPILLKKCELPTLLRHRKYIDFRRESEFNENCRLLAEALRASPSKDIPILENENKIKLEQVEEKLNSLVTPEEAQRWLYASLKMFDGRRPIDLIANGETDRVMQILIRLEEGIHN
jgi:hypothetical protein